MLSSRVAFARLNFNTQNYCSRLGGGKMGSRIAALRFCSRLFSSVGFAADIAGKLIKESKLRSANLALTGCLSLGF